MRQLKKQLSRLPSHVKTRAVNVIQLVKSGIPLREFNGKFIGRTEHRFFSVKITQNYRLLCAFTNGQWKPKWVGSHSDYNKTINQI